MNYDHLFCLGVLICEKTLGNTGTSYIGLKLIQNSSYLSQNHLLFFGIDYIYNLESCFLFINLVTPKKGKVGLKLDNLSISEIYTVVPSSGKKEYYLLLITRH